MATGPGESLEAAGHGRLRASDADREQVIGTIKAAFVQGRLTQDELVARVGQALAARTYRELTALTADLPAGLADAVPGVRAAPVRARRPASTAVKAGIWITIAVGVPLLLFVSAGMADLFLLLTPFYFAALAFLGAEIVTSRQKPRGGGGHRPTGESPRRQLFRPAVPVRGPRTGPPLPD